MVVRAAAGARQLSTGRQVFVGRYSTASHAYKAATDDAARQIRLLFSLDSPSGFPNTEKKMRWPSFIGNKHLSSYGGRGAERVASGSGGDGQLVNAHSIRVT